MAILQEVPMRGSLDRSPPTDPTIYRFHEGDRVRITMHGKFLPYRKY